MKDLTKQKFKATARGFTLIEILIVLAVLGLLAALLLPAFSRTRESARRVTCASNLKQIGLGLHQYVQDSDGRMPARYVNHPGNSDPGGNANGHVKRYNWRVQIYPYLKNTELFRCPSNPENKTSATSANSSQPIDIIVPNA